MVSRHVATQHRPSSDPALRRRVESPECPGRGRVRRGHKSNFPRRRPVSQRLCFGGRTPVDPRLVTVSLIPLHRHPRRAPPARSLRRGVSGAAEFVPGLPPGLQSRVHDTWPSYIVLADSTVSPFREAIRGLERVLPLASAVVLNSFVELYPAVVFLDLEAKLSTASVLNVGFHTVSLPMITTTAKSDTAESDSVMTWLDGQEPNSVVYVSFGTVIGFSNEELWAIAEALEEKGKAFPFLWSLPDRQKRALPDGFVERTSRFGKVVAWAHQLRVLGHVSVGVHVSYCGCNSVNESIAIGVPMIVRPVWADNHVNAKMVESVWKIGVGFENGVFTKNGFVEALELVLEREEGKKMRERALALKKLVFDSSAPNGSATRDFNSLLDLVRG